MGRLEFEPPDGEGLDEWCSRQDQSPVHRKLTRVKSLLGMWMLWKHRNDIVFNGATPSLPAILLRIREEGILWAKTGLMKGNTFAFEADDGRPDT